MMVSFSRRVRSVLAPVVGAVTLGAMVVGCGDDASNPDAVTVQELKGPGALKIWDKGNGAVTLEWSGSNNEEDFDGYNVYGMKNTAENKLVDMNGKALELLNDKGEPVDEARTYLSHYNYDPADGKKFEAKGEAVNSDGEAEFSALPIHTKDGETPLLPTCKNSGGTCAPTAAANKDKKGEAASLNGKTKYEVTGLTVGSTYCFLVLSSIDGGTKVSQTSSNVACVTPKYGTNFSMPLPAAAATNQKFDLKAWLAACTAAACADPATTHFAVDPNSHFGQAAGPAYIEFDSQGPSFVPGKNSSVIDLGYYAGGLLDATLPAKAPKLVIDTNEYNPNNDPNRRAPVYNGGGYAVPGQSVPILKDHVYVFAVGDATAATASTTFHYHWMFVSGDPKTGTSVAVQMLLSKSAQ